MGNYLSLAKNRLKAIEEFSSLGAGFAIAMKDLEIRGAGNILGPQQSGHIAAVGYEMYCKLLQVAMDTARSPKSATAHPPQAHIYETQEVDVDLRLQAFIPDQLVPEPKIRLELLREMDGAHDLESISAIGRSIADRYGSLPKTLQTLLFVFLLKHRLTDHGVLGIQFIDDDRIIVRHPRNLPLGGAWIDHYADVRLVEPGKTHLMLPKRRGKKGPYGGADVLRLVLKSLLGRDEMPMIEKAWSGKNANSRGRRGTRSKS